MVFNMLFVDIIFSPRVIIDNFDKKCYNNEMEDQRAKAARPPLRKGYPSRRKKGEMLMYITYADLIQTGI